ncbi:hypothetical protein [Paraburkholderia diazotrophica]|uniref:Uncharacterized protein n=1 Tax=Paraburkholderia diazotrophica TaxID=667676 RepID=A0A1H7BEF2_9BURK|nr:hypothetical protein [Paraburkholderia diazotrophica]SEJ74677.1 hypothetical protein SAMN05192539_101753 [Paraburkholderia diazotrophica]
MTVQNNHFSTQLQHVNHPSAVERPAARNSTTTAASTETAEKTDATPASASPAGLVGNHVNTTA